MEDSIQAFPVLVLGCRCRITMGNHLLTGLLNDKSGALLALKRSKTLEEAGGDSYHSAAI